MGAVCTAASVARAGRDGRGGRDCPAVHTVLEALDLSLGRARGDRAAYLLSLETALVGLLALGGMLAVLGLGRSQFVGALALSGLSVAAVTALGDVVQDRHIRPWVGWTAAAVTGLVIIGGALGVLGLLEPPKVFAPGTWSQAEAYVPPPAATRPVLPVPTTNPTPFPTPAPGRTPTSVSARRPCSPSDLTLAVGEFDFAMGARLASISASNRSGSACYLRDGSSCRGSPGPRRTRPDPNRAVADDEVAAEAWSPSTSGG